jgi:hypothetical protein
MESMTGLSHYGKRHIWRKYMYKWQRSGMTVTDFCQTYSIPRTSFYRWRRELEDPRAGNDIDQGVSNTNPARVVPFVEVKMHRHDGILPGGPTSATDKELICACRRLMGIFKDFDTKVLELAITFLENQAC